jgi:cell division protein FtsL
MSKLADLISNDQLPLVLLFVGFLVAMAAAAFNHDFRDVAVAAFGAFSGAAGMQARKARE